MLTFSNNNNNMILNETNTLLLIKSVSFGLLFRLNNFNHHIETVYLNKHFNFDIIRSKFNK